MNAPRFLSIDFGTDEVSDTTVQNFPSQPVHASKAAAHGFASWTASAGRTKACRAWPSASGLIYVVDAYSGLAQLAKAILNVDGFQTCAFEDRVEAWRAFAFADPRPGLLIVDNLDGAAAALELIRQCRALEPKLKTLLVEHRLPFNLPVPAENLVDGRLALPYCSAQLLQEVRRLCPQRVTQARSGWVAK